MIYIPVGGALATTHVYTTIYHVILRFLYVVGRKNEAKSVDMWTLISIRMLIQFDASALPRTQSQLARWSKRLWPQRVQCGFR